MAEHAASSTTGSRRWSRPASVAVDVGVSLVGLLVIVASIERIGFVGDAESAVSWPIAIPGIVLLAVAPVLAAWVRWRTSWIRPATTAAALALLVAVLMAALSGSIAVGILVWVLTQMLVMAIAPD